MSGFRASLDVIENFTCFFGANFQSRPTVPDSLNTAPNSLPKPSQTISRDASKIVKISIKCVLGRWDAYFDRHRGGESLSVSPSGVRFPRIYPGFAKISPVFWGEISTPYPPCQPRQIRGQTHFRSRAKATSPVRLQNCKNLNKMRLGTVVRLFTLPNRAGGRICKFAIWRLALEPSPKRYGGTGAVRLTVRVKPQKSLVFMRLGTAVRLKPYCVCPPSPQRHP